MDEKIDLAPIDGKDGATASGPIDIKGKIKRTARLSVKGKGMLAGLAVILAGGIVVGVMTAGGGNKASQAVAQPAATADVGSVSPPAAPSPEEIAKAKLATRGAGEPAGSPGAPAATGLQTRDGGAGQNPPAAVAGGNAAPTAKEAFKQWREKHHYERLQGLIISAEAATTAEPLKGGSGNALMGGMKPAKADAGDDRINEARQRALAALAANPQAAQNPEMQALLKSLAAGGGAGGGAAGGTEFERAQAKNEAFLAKADAKNPVYLSERVQYRQGEHELAAGSVIPAVMLTAINSDLPGAISAQVRQTVYDTNDPDTVVIPQGSRLVGRYSNSVVYGQKRVLIAWDNLIFPNGNSITLKGMAGADGQGRAGFEDEVDTHFWRTWGAALMTSMLGVGVQLSQPQNQGTFNAPTASSQAASAVANSLNQAGQAVLNKNLNAAPTLMIRPGYAFSVIVNRTIILPAYR